MPQPIPPPVPTLTLVVLVVLLIAIAAAMEVRLLARKQVQVWSTFEDDGEIVDQWDEEIGVERRWDEYLEWLRRDT